MVRFLMSIITVFRRWLLVVLLGGSMLVPAAAVEVNDLYEATVAVTGRSQAQQAIGMNEAFRVVIGKVAGASVDAAVTRPLLKRTQQFVRSYAYLGGKGQPLMMQVSFDRVAVDDALRGAGIPVWGSNRPLVLLWMAIDENGQRRVVSPESDATIASAINVHVNQRGTPVNLPLYDLQDMAALSVADVWGQFDERIRSASAHYRADLIATARVKQEGDRWRGDWTLSLPGTGASFQTSAAGRDEAIQAGLEWISEQVRSTYASAAVATDVPGSGLLLVVEGVHDLAAHAALTRLLSASVVIRSVSLESVEGDRVTFAVLPAASTDTLLQSLTAGGRLSLPAGDAGEASGNEGVLRLSWKG